MHSRRRRRVERFIAKKEKQKKKLGKRKRHEVNEYKKGGGKEIVFVYGINFLRYYLVVPLLQPYTKCLLK